MKMDIERLIDYFCGAPPGERPATKHRATAMKLAAAGHEISPHAVKKWRERDSIPADWLVRMLQVSQKEGQALDLANYI